MTPNESLFRNVWREYCHAKLANTDDRAATRTLLAASWSCGTAHPNHQQTWKIEEPGVGQSDVSSLLVNEILGGDIMVMFEEDRFGTSLHFNRVPRGPDSYVYVDLTSGIEDMTDVNRGSTYDRSANMMHPLDVLIAGDDARLKQRFERFRNAAFEVMVNALR